MLDIRNKSLGLKLLASSWEMSRYNLPDGTRGGDTWRPLLLHRCRFLSRFSQTELENHRIETLDEVWIINEFRRSRLFLNDFRSMGICNLKESATTAIKLRLLTNE